VTHPFATWEDVTGDVANINWVRDYRAAIAPYATGGTYLNFIGDEGEERIAAAFGEPNLKRLREIKGEYDPENVFAGNQNIRPLVGV
jgi:FAD/FMN-containing dehydrogenase